MAPKAAKPAPGAEPPKGKDAKDEKVVEYMEFEELNPLKKVPTIAIYLFLLLVAVISIVVISVFFKAYLRWKPPEKETFPHVQALKTMRRSLAYGCRETSINYISYARMAKRFDEVEKCEAKNQEVFEERKNKYRNIFEKSTKSGIGWDIFKSALYYISKEKTTWYDAENFCTFRDSHLASILTTEEQNYITMQFSEPFWIGLSNENMEGDWKWTDGSIWVTEHWAPHNSSLSDTMEKGCAFVAPLVEGPNWNKDNCLTLKRWVCKESMETPGES